MKRIFCIDRSYVRHDKWLQGMKSTKEGSSAAYEDGAL
jgi:hypothetical protein